MTSKERAKLKAQAMKMDSIFQIGKASLTPQIVNAVRNALEARELIKIGVLKNCADDPAELASLVSERTGSQVVQVIGKKIILYKKNVKKEEKKNQEQKQKNAKKKTASQTGGRRDRPFLSREKDGQDKEKVFEIKSKKHAMREKEWVQQARRRKPDRRNERPVSKVSWEGHDRRDEKLAPKVAWKGHDRHDGRPAKSHGLEVHGGRPASQVSPKGNGKKAAFRKEAKKQGRYGRKPATQTGNRKWGSRNG